MTMREIRLWALVGLWAVVATCCGIHAAANEPASAAASNLLPWIQQLEHPDYRVRAQATKALAEAGAQAIEPLRAALSSESPEVRMRVVLLLGRIYSRGDESTFEQAESALEEVRDRMGGSLRSRAEKVLATHFELRQRLAAERIAEMGGSIFYRSEATMRGEEPAENPDAERPDHLMIVGVGIGRNWKGGDEGLKQITRLSQVQVLYRIGESPVTDAAISALQDRIPQLKVESRGPAYFGITPDFHPRGCVIREVAPNSAASVAGIQPQDLVTHFDGKEVVDPNHMIDLIAEKQPGDSVPVVLERNGQVLELKAALTDWPKIMKR